MDRADAAEEKVRQMTDKLERIEEELRDTQKKMMQTENDLDKAQEDLSVANSNLEEKEKKVQEVFLDDSFINDKLFTISTVVKILFLKKHDKFRQWYHNNRNRERRK